MNLSNFMAATAIRCWRIDDENGVSSQIRLKLGVIDASWFLYLAAVLSSWLVKPHSLHRDTVAVCRHADAVRVEASHVKANLVATSGVRILEIQSLHFVFVEYVSTTAATRYQRISQHLVASPLHVAWMQPQKFISVIQQYSARTILPFPYINIITRVQSMKSILSDIRPTCTVPLCMIFRTCLTCRKY